MNANFSDPCDASWSSDGRIFIADAGNHRIRVLSTDGSTVRTFAGSKLKGFQDGAADQAQFAWPEGVATMDGGRVFIADTGNHSIRVIESQTVSTLAGKPTAGFKDGDAKTEASFHSPRAIDLAKNGAIFIADAGNHAIRRLFDGRVETIAGSGDAGFRDGELSEAKFEDPSGIEVGEDGSIYVADTGNQRIRRIHNGMVTTIAGIGAPGYRDGPASLAAFSSPADVEVHKGTLFVADAGNNVIRVIKDGKVGTFAGR
jgi:DNA-binding beta-propeller fold protein YncE